MQVINSIIDQLCDFHIKQSNEDVSTDEYGNEYSPEFTRSDYFIFPVEILTWLAIRRELNLPDYKPQNELMKLDINQLPKEKLVYEKDELVEQCKVKLQNDNPGLVFDF